MVDPADDAFQSNGLLQHQWRIARSLRLRPATARRRDG
jgi:hypothetical protein